METFVFWFRLLNVALSVFVFVLCVLKLVWNTPDKTRVTRIAGLGFLTIAAASVSYDLRYSEFHYRIPIITIGLALAAYGLRALQTKPEAFREQKKSS